MHTFPSPRLRHRLLAAHVAAGAGALGAGAALFAWSRKDLTAVDTVGTVLVIHLAPVAAVVGVLAFRRHWNRSTGEVANGGSDRTPSHWTKQEP